ncbi:preprotein translocase subunit SecE [Candidatus Saccharibacteria bacterium]|nr:preprotein translocase subunit SecE [Candidatus Saccharibacteria bacterium]
MKNSAKRQKRTPKQAKKATQKSGGSPKIFRPFIRFGSYIAASFRELRLMRFPNRKAAWKMTFAVIIYALIFFIFISLLDAFWSAVFQRILG